MNELDDLIRDTLRADAQEAAMTTNTSHERQELETRLDTVDVHRLHTRWLALAAVLIVVLVLGAGTLALRGARNGAIPIGPVSSPTASSGHDTASPTSGTPLTLTLATGASFTVTEPSWTNGGDRSDTPGVAVQANCVQPCPGADDRNISILAPRHFYSPAAGRIVTSPSYSQYLAGWDAVAGVGWGTVLERRPATVAGHPAVLVTVRWSAQNPGLAFTDSATEAVKDRPHNIAGVTSRVAIVNVSGRPLVIVDNAYKLTDTTRQSAEWDDVVQSLIVH